MTEYLPIGDFYPMDTEGHVLNRTDRGHLDKQWRELADEVVREFKKVYYNRMVGVYLRGSVPAGSAVKGVSDFDAFAVLDWEEGEEFYRWAESAWGRTSGRRLQDQHPVASKVEMAVCSWKGGDFSHSPHVRNMIATQALCLDGEDLVPKLPAPHLSELKRHLPWLEEDWKACKDAGKMQEASAGRTLIKTLIRGVFEEVMEVEGKYATDFHPCIEVISKYKPDWKKKLKTLVHIFCSPEGRQGELIEIAEPLINTLLKP